MKYCLAFHGWEVSSSPTVKELLLPTEQCGACGSISWCSPFKIYTVVSVEAARYAWGQSEKVVEGGGRWRWRRRVWPWKSPPGGAVEGQQEAPTVHKARLVWDKQRAPGGPYGTIFTIRASLFSLGFRVWACQESSMLAGLEVVFGSTVRGERGFQGGPEVSGAPQLLPLVWYLFA